MDTKTLAAAIAGFLLGGFVTSVAATLDDDNGSGDGGSHGSPPVTTSRSAEHPG